MTYDRANRNAYVLAAGTGAMRKAAEVAGLFTYQVPFCGAGFAGHFRSTRAGKCVVFGPMRVALGQTKDTAAKNERKTAEANARQAAHNLGQSTQKQKANKHA